MTDKTTELIASYRGWDVKEIKRYPLDAARVIADLLSKLEAEHQEVETLKKSADADLQVIIAGQQLSKAIEAERDALRAAIQEALAVELRSDQMPYRAWPMFQDDVRRILSRAIDMKEEGNG